MALETTIKSILFTINQHGPNYWRELRDVYKANSVDDLHNAAGTYTEDTLHRAEELFDTALSDVLDPLLAIGSLDVDSAEVVRQALSSVAVRAELGRRLDGLVRYFVTPYVLGMLPETRRMPSPEQSKVLATAWMAVISILDSLNPELTLDWLVRVLDPLAQCTTDVGTQEQWPFVLFDNIPLDTTKHNPMVCHLQEETFPDDLSHVAPGSLPLTDTKYPEGPPLVVFHPLQGPYMSQKPKRSHDDEHTKTSDSRAQSKDQDTRDAVKARRLANGGRKSDKASSCSTQRK
ncbi:hypothetical protein ONZ45_g8442 [Pleurotus djamor]|nr:hypothetical protein ONZ45_g8442 [Pleurotus djamor]